MTAASLSHRIRSEGSLSGEFSQVARRLRDLLPQTLRLLKHQHRGNGKSARAERLALADTHYQRAIDEYVNMKGKALEARVQYDTHRMLLQARQSLRRYHLPPSSLG